MKEIRVESIRGKEQNQIPKRIGEDIKEQPVKELHVKFQRQERKKERKAISSIKTIFFINCLGMIL